MAKSYTISEAAEFLGTGEAEVEDLVASGEISFEIIEDEYRIPEDLLLKVRVSLHKERTPKKPTPFTILDDTQFTGYFEDFISLKLNEVIRKIDTSFHTHAVELNNVRKFLTKRIDMYKEPLMVLTELESVMKKALESSLSKMNLSGGGGLGKDGLDTVTQAMESVLEKSIKQQDDILRALRKLESRVASGDEKIYKALEKIWKSNQMGEVKSRIEGLAKYLNESVSDKINTLRQDLGDLTRISERLDTLRDGLGGGPTDHVQLMETIGELQEDQKRLRKVVSDLNVSFKNSLLEKTEEFNVIASETPKLLNDLQEVMPALLEVLEQKASQAENLSGAAKDIVQDKEGLGDKDELVRKLDEVLASIELTGGGFMVPHVEEKLGEIRRDMEQLFLSFQNQQNKALKEQISQLALPSEKITNTVSQIQQMNAVVASFSRDLERDLLKVGEAFDRLKSYDPGNLDQKLMGRLEEAMAGLIEKLEQSLPQALEKSVADSLGTLKESQESFQNVVVNMNINNQKALMEKLTHLDRLNELVSIRDNVEEITEQLQTFEAITADINQLVDERLQFLGSINEQLENLSTGGIGVGAGDQTGKVSKILDDIRSSLDDFQGRFSIDYLLGQFKQLVEEQSADLRQNQEAAQKILVNLNINSQKWLREKLDLMDVDRETFHRVNERFKSVEDSLLEIITRISERQDLLQSTGQVIDRMEGEGRHNRDLDQIREVIEKETRALRKSVENTQKIVQGLGNGNRQFLSEKLENADLPENALDILARENARIIQSLIGNISPDETLVSILEEIRVVLDSIKGNLNTEHLLEKLVEFNNHQTKELKEDQTETVAVLKGLQEQLTTSLTSRVDQIHDGIAEVLANLDTESMVASIGEVLVESNDLLREQQANAMNAITRNHRDMVEQIQNLRLTAGTSSDGGVNPQDLLPVLERLTENQLEAFKKEMEGSQKILVNLNVNLQKQLLGRIQEIMEEQASIGVSVNRDDLATSINGIFEEKLTEIRENQETLLNLNLKIQKSLKTELGALKNSPPSDSPTAIAKLEEILTDKIERLDEVYGEFRESLDKMTRKNHHQLMDRLDQALEKAGTSTRVNLDEYLPLIQEGLAETYKFLGTIKQDIDRLGARISSGGAGIAGGGPSSDMSMRMEETMMIKMDEDRETLRIISQRIQHIVDLVKEIYQQGGQGSSRGTGKATAPVIEEKLNQTQEMESKILDAITRLQEEMGRDSFPGSSDDPGIQQEILDSITRTRRDQEELSVKLESLIETIHSLPRGSSREKDEDNETSEAEKENLRMEIKKQRELNKSLEKEKLSLKEQLRIAHTVEGDPARTNNLQAVMQEKDRLLEECYREKVELREQLEKEKRDKYEIIQRYETEKKELIDSLALERIQREKDRAELELLRAESRKKKWW